MSNAYRLKMSLLTSFVYMFSLHQAYYSTIAVLLSSVTVFFAFPFIFTAFDVTRDIVLKKRPWSDLFKPSFFFTYRHYLCVIVSGNEKRPFKERCGLVESRLRVLVSNLESIRYVQLAHVNSHAYGRGPKDEKAEFIKKWFIGIVFGEDAGQSTTSVNHLATNHTNNNNNNSNDTQPSDHHRVNVDLTKEVRSFELALERGTSSELTPNVVVTIKHLKR